MRTFDASPPCTEDPGRWFSKDEARRNEAKRVCATCPFQDPCRELSNLPIETTDGVLMVSAGVWAGEDKVDDLADYYAHRKSAALTPKQRQTRDRLIQIKKYRAEGLSGYQIGKKMGLGSGSVNHLVNTYLKEKA